MEHSYSSHEDHDINEMIVMYETVCTNLRTLKDDARIVGVYELFDYVSLFLAHMLKNVSPLDVKQHNAEQLKNNTESINKDQLISYFIDFDRTLYGRAGLNLAMDAVRFNECQKKIFWWKVKEYLENEDDSERSYAASEESVMSYDPDIHSYVRR